MDQKEESRSDDVAVSLPMLSQNKEDSSEAKMDREVSVVPGVLKASNKGRGNRGRGGAARAKKQ